MDREIDWSKLDRCRRKKRRRRPVFLYLLIVAAVAALIWAAVFFLIPREPEVDLQISLKGEAEITLEFGEEYIDDGVDIFLNIEDAQAQLEISGEVDPSTLGSYTIAYTASYLEHTATIQRTVTIVDTQIPEIILMNLGGSYAEPGTVYQEEGFRAVDNYDGDITDQVERVEDGDVVIYTVTDSSGNTARVERQIVYDDKTAPSLKLEGEDTVTISVGTGFKDPGYTAYDNVDGDITDSVTVTGDVDIYTPGTYTLRYSVTDEHGNTSVVSRTVVVETVKQPDPVDPGSKVIYLTFDDGPSKYTLELLEVLEKYNVKATFFVVGTSALQYLDEIADGGHSIGIHSNTHVFSEIYVSVDAYLNDLNALREKIYDRTGIYTTLVRFPGGSSNSISSNYCEGIMTELAQILTDSGFQYFDWNVDSKDAGGAKTADEVYNNVIKGVQSREVSIVLQHDIKQFSVEAVERIIQWGLANGYTFLPLDETSPTAHHTITN